MREKNNKKNRAAIYTRVSTENGLGQAFNSLDAQREAGEAYVRSQEGCGWVLLSARYDDGGYSGATVVRPALRRLMDDVAEGKLDVVVVYKIDRFSRSLMGFAELMEKLERHSVGIVSVTQQFNTTTPSGTLMLNMLISFASYERQVIAERVRDKSHAARRRGKWIGGIPALGYDIGGDSKGLVINEMEAQRVRRIFEIYIENQSLSRTVAEASALNWTNKSYLNSRGERKGGGSFNKTTIHRLLTNYLYLGKVAFRGKVYEGEHEGIVDEETFEKVHSLLASNRRNGGSRVKNKYGAFLKGLLKCKACKSASMTPSITKKSNGRIYRYYLCVHAQKVGWRECPAPSLPAAEIEGFVLDQIRGVGKSEVLRQAVWGRLNDRFREHSKETQQTIRDLEKQRVTLEKRIRLAIGQNESADEFVFLEEKFAEIEKELSFSKKRLAELGASEVSENEIGLALNEFENLWATLTGQERCDLMAALVERVDYDGPSEQVTLSFRSEGIRSLIEEKNEVDDGE